jgi:uncharacterized membrane protein (DUF4010 family)
VYALRQLLDTRGSVENSCRGILANAVNQSFTRYRDTTGFYGVSLMGGLVSSASAVASAGTLAAHASIPVAVASVGAVLASYASVLINLPLIARLAADRGLTQRLARAWLRR